MTAETRAAGMLASPCVGICRLDPDTGWCLGCARDAGELTDWATLGDHARDHLQLRRQRAGGVEWRGQRGRARERRRQLRLRVNGALHDGGQLVLEQVGARRHGHGLERVGIFEGLGEIADLVVPFRRDVYRMVAQAFAEFTR